MSSLTESLPVSVAVQKLGKVLLVKRRAGKRTRGTLMPRTRMYSVAPCKMYWWTGLQSCLYEDHLPRTHRRSTPSKRAWDRVIGR